MKFNPIFLGFFLFIILLFGSNVNAQNPKEFDSIFRKIFLEISQKDYEKSKFLADSLYQISTTPLYKTKSLMLSASLCQQAGDIKEAIQYASEAEKHIQGSKDWDWKARVYGFLATQFRYVRLLNQSQKYVDKTLEISESIEDPIKKNNLLGFVYQEKAYHEIEKKNFKQSIVYLHTSGEQFSKSNVQDKLLLATNLQLLGLNHYYLEDFTTSYSYYFQALNELADLKQTYMYSLVNNGIANLYIDEDKLDESKKHLDEAYRISEKSTHLSLNIEVLKTLEKYYMKVKDFQNLNLTKMKKDSVIAKLNKNSYSFIDQAYSGLENSKNETDEISKNKELTIYAVSAIFLFSIVYFVSYRRKKKKEFHHIKNALMELELRLASDQFSTPKTSFESDDFDSMDESIRLMPKKTEESLLEKLADFEKSNFYLKKNISLASLASRFDTNTKYLSYVINQHKGKEFKNYIKELRIIYIIRKMEENPHYRMYKIAVLSEETGFSSPSKFASAFKKVTKVAPSAYIQHLKEKSQLVEAN